MQRRRDNTIDGIVLPLAGLIVVVMVISPQFRPLLMLFLLAALLLISVWIAYCLSMAAGSQIGTATGLFRDSKRNSQNKNGLSEKQSGH